MGIMKALFEPTKKQGVYSTGNGYFKAYYNGIIVGYHKEKAYCVEVYRLYKQGVLKI